MKSTFLTNMKNISDTTKSDKELMDIIDTSSQRTRRELESATHDNQKFTQYLGLQSVIAENAEKYLRSSQTSFEKFKSLIKNPSVTKADRLLNGLTFGFYKPKLTPGKVGNIVLDLYTNMAEHKGMVQTSYDILQNRRGIIYESAKEAAQGIRDHGLQYVVFEKQLERLTKLNDLMKKGSLQDSALTTTQLEEMANELSYCSNAGLFDGAEIIERINKKDDIKPDLIVLQNDVDLTRAKLSDMWRDEGLEVKGGHTMLEGIALQKKQYEETIKAMGIQLKELDVDLRYTKILAQNTFYLAKGQEVSQKALNGFETYRNVMNMTQRFNSLGARLMLDRVGYILVTPFFDPKVLEAAHQEIDEAVGMYLKNDQIFHENVKTLVQQLGIKEKVE